MSNDIVKYELAYDTTAESWYVIHCTGELVTVRMGKDKATEICARLNRPQVDVEKVILKIAHLISDDTKGDVRITDTGLRKLEDILTQAIEGEKGGFSE